MLSHDGGICILYTEEVKEGKANVGKCILFIRENRLIIHAPIILSTLVRTLCYRILLLMVLSNINEVSNACH